MIRADYVVTARAKGLSERRIILRHVIPNGLIPVIQVLGNGLGASLAGALVIEAIVEQLEAKQAIRAIRNRRAGEADPGGPVVAFRGAPGADIRACAPP